MDLRTTWMEFASELVVKATLFKLKISEVPRPRTIGDVTFDVHTLLYSAGAIFIGFQSILFAVFARIFAITEKLVPPDPQLDKLFRFINLERGLIAVGSLTAVGIFTSLYALSDWGEQFFGPNGSQSNVPGGHSGGVGAHSLVPGHGIKFFLSILGLARPPRRWARTGTAGTGNRATARCSSAS